MTMLVIFLGMSVALLTTSSLSALLTNGSPKEHPPGGVYYYLSRTIGPEFGGAIGLIYYIAQAFAIAFYMLGFGEVMHATLGVSMSNVTMASLGLFGCYIIAIAGTALFAKMSTIILALIILGISLALLTLLFRTDQVIPDACAGTNGFRGPSGATFSANFLPNYQDGFSWLLIFGICYPSMTGILGGANIAGQLRDPMKSVPLGTFYGVMTMGAVYSSIVLFLGASVDRDCLVADYYILQNTCWSWQLVFIGALCSTFSSGLSAIVGASRVLQALAHDGIFPIITKLNRSPDTNANPYLAITFTYLMGQSVMFMGQVNVVAPFLTNFILLTFLIINFSCWTMSILRAPNFRPRFRYYSWLTSLLGWVLCLILMFLTSVSVTIASIFALVALFAYLAYFITPLNEWGFLGQALLFAVVRKTMPLLDPRKQHVKFWRPQVLLLTNSDPDPFLVDLSSGLRKGGMSLIGNIQHGEVWASLAEHDEMLSRFRDSVERLDKNAFVDVVVTPTFVQGAISLLTSSGLGVVRPNTLVIGHRSAKEGALPLSDYLKCIATGLALKKNVVVARNFDKITSKAGLIAAATSPGTFGKLIHYLELDVGPQGSKTGMYIDVFLLPDQPLFKERAEARSGHSHVVSSDAAESVVTTMQLAWVFHTKTFWKSNSRLRVVALCEAHDLEARRKSVLAIMDEIRFQGELLMVTVESASVDSLAASVSINSTHPASTHDPGASVDAEPMMAASGAVLGTSASGHTRWQPDDGGYNEGRLSALNDLIRANTRSTAVIFMAVPSQMMSPEKIDQLRDDIASDSIPPQLEQTVNQLEMLSLSLPPVAMVMPGGQNITSLTI
eukprot:TRINITY_DN2223_c0_g1_i2.p1 TRINITY_DN2223_c0_g1~~TRINITY_DN2223_c0_g1_i2.p1  ORF type:complete len:931 (+),score=228.69 TRINITY_DN2223_c0_g1_i2:269-2794(+)